jgi:hypothetical protein
MGRYGITFIDNSKEKASFAVGTVDITAGNLVAQTALTATLKSAIAGISIGTLADERLLAIDAHLSRTPPSSVSAQREMKWLVVSEGQTTHRLFRHEIPCADPTLNVSGSDKVNIAAAPFAAFVSAWNALAYNPDTADVLHVLYIQFVGRSL